MYEYLTEFVSEEQLLWSEESYSGANLEPFALNEFVQIKFLNQLILRFVKKLVSLRRLESLNETLEEACWIILLVDVEVFY